MPKCWLKWEVGIVFLLIMGQIWLWRDYQYIAALPLLLVMASWRLRNDNLQTLGLRSKRRNPEMDLFLFIVFFIFWWMLMAISVFIHQENLAIKFIQIDFWLKYGRKILFYLPWAFFQQLCANGYFASRINAVTKNPKKTAWLVGLLFAVIHFPNPVLMAVTFFGGALSAYFFLNGGSLYYLALAHAVLAPTIKMFLDYSGMPCL